MSTGYLLGIDYGGARVGLALASMIARLPTPFETIDNGPDLIEKLLEIIKSQNVITVVVGLPRSLEGNETRQTTLAREFASKLKAHGLHVVLQDEAATSIAAEEELQARGEDYTKEEIDALAATYILDDYLRERYG